MHAKFALLLGSGGEGHGRGGEGRGTFPLVVNLEGISTLRIYYDHGIPKSTRNRSK
jgi:hypothetical protein